MMTKRAICIGLIVAAGGATWVPRSAGGQSGSPAQGAEIKGRAPVSNEILQVKLPRPQEADLTNGLHLMTLEDHRTPTISFQIVIPGAGGYFDPPDRPGLAEFVASMMREGTASRTSQQIAERLETMAATLSVSAGMASEIATISGSCLTEYFDELLEIAADVLLRPSFPAEELDRFKTRTRTGLVQQRSNPTFLASEAFARVIYGSHPAGRVSPAPESLDATTRDDLVTFHRERYVPDQALMGIAGDISMSDARKKIEAKLESWKKSGRVRPSVANPVPTTGAGVYLVDRPSSVQTALVVGGQAIDRLSPDHDILEVLNQVVGGGPTGRLFMNLREAKGYTYGAYSSVSARRYRGDWRASTNVRTEVTEPALGELVGEIRRIRDERVPAKELQDAKRAIVAGFALSLESPTGILDSHIERWLYDLPVDYVDRYPDRIMAVTDAQVQAVAQKYLDTSRMQIVAVGDVTAIERTLAMFGPVTKYDAEGKAAGL